MKIPHRLDYKEHRARAYPGAGDFMDAFYWERRGDPSKMETWLRALDEIKRRFPEDRPKEKTNDRT